MMNPGSSVVPGGETGTAKNFLHKADGLLTRAVTLVNEAPASGNKRWQALTPSKRPPVPHLLGRRSTSPGKYYPFVWAVCTTGGTTTKAVITGNARELGFVVGDEVNVWDSSASGWLTEQTISAISADGTQITVDTEWDAVEVPTTSDILVINQSLGLADASEMLVLMEPYSTDVDADEEIIVQAAYAGHFLKDAFPTFCTDANVFDITKMQRITLYDPQT